MDDWRAEIDGDVLACSKDTGPTPPSEVGRRLGISEDAAASLLSILAGTGRVRICLVELPSPPGAPTCEAGPQRSTVDHEGREGGG